MQKSVREEFVVKRELVTSRISKIAGIKNKLTIWCCNGRKITLSWTGYDEKMENILACSRIFVTETTDTHEILSVEPVL